MEFIALYQELHDSLEIIRVFFGGPDEEIKKPCPIEYAENG